jgi:hypothetical protein
LAIESNRFGVQWSFTDVGSALTQALL